MINTKISSEIYRRVANDNTEHPYTYWHASSLAECPRAHYYKRLHVPKTRSVGAGKMLRWKAGHVFEEAIRPFIDGEQSNNRFTSELYKLTGEYDNYYEPEKALIEIKTVHDYAIKEKKMSDGSMKIGLKLQVGTMPNGNKKWDVKDHPYEHHLLQQHGYKLLMAEKGIEVEKMIFVYLTLSGRVIVYEEEPQKEYDDMVLERLDILNKAWERQEPPECICNETNHLFYASVMQFCDYQDGNECCSLKLINN